MSAEKKPFVNVDQLMGQISVEDAARYYGIEPPALHQVGGETRTRCFLVCGKAQETGDRVLAIQTGNPVKTRHCHQYGCGKGGNLVSLCDLMKSGESAGGRPRGQRFKEIAADLKAMVEGTPPPAGTLTVATPKPVVTPANVPLCQSENERARGLVALDRKFVTDVAAMAPKASAYVRRRPFLTPEAMARWRVGYLPHDTGGDKAGGTMRGKIVYCYRSHDGEVLTWFGRNVAFEEEHKAWEGTDKTEREPEKFHFVKGFHRGIELFGQHELLAEEKVEKLDKLGLILVEGPNDVIRLDALGVPAVALCSNRITREQAAWAAAIARAGAGGVVTVFLDNDAEGENGMKQCLGYVAQLVPVRLAWSARMYGGKFKGRQPESLTIQEWEEISEYLTNASTVGWAL